jgi:fatty-acyl-CoA synthase
VTGITVRKHDPALELELIEREGVSRAFVTPSFLIDWLDEPSLDERDLSCLRAVICGTAALHGAKAAEAMRRIGPVLHIGYGLAEVLPPAAMLAPEEFDPEHPLRVGRPVSGVEVRIGPDDGLIHIDSPTCTRGYWSKPAREGPFPTGDVGYLDDQGRLNIAGRASEMIPGLAVHPREIEEVVHRHPAVKECAVVESDGETVLVCSVRSGRAVAEGELAAFLAGRIDRRLMPDRAVCVEGDLPRSPAGKIERSRA